ncbi:MAG: hypothetical protein IBJ10_01290 [Phycisphaerales bacterium]|nr:hypothetical protein [Phycisphaerales bacterium]
MKALTSRQLGFAALAAVALLAVVSCAGTIAHVVNGGARLANDNPRNPRNPSGVTGANLPQVVNGAPVSTTQVLVALYGDAAQRINHQLARAVEDIAGRRTQEFKRARAAQLLHDIGRTQARLAAQSAPVVLEANKAAYVRGLRDGIRQAEELGVKGVADALGARAGFTAVDEGPVNVAARDTAARINAAAGLHAQGAASVFRSLSEGAPAEPAVNAAIARGLITGDPRVADRAMRDLYRDPNAPEIETYRRVGAQQITVGGWTGPVRAYVATVVRTRTREATEEARGDRLDALGLDLVQITGRVSVNFCTQFIGLVLSRSGADPDHPALADLPGGGPPFHPNCSKSTAAYLPGAVGAERAAAARKAGAAFAELPAHLRTAPLRAT